MKIHKYIARDGHNYGFLSTHFHLFLHSKILYILKMFS